VSMLAVESAASNSSRKVERSERTAI